MGYFEVQTSADFVAVVEGRDYCPSTDWIRVLDGRDWMPYWEKKGSCIAEGFEVQEASKSVGAGPDDNRLEFRSHLYCEEIMDLTLACRQIVAPSLCSEVRQ